MLKKTKIILVGIPGYYKSFQLALYNLKAYLLEYVKDSQSLDIDLLIIQTKTKAKNPFDRYAVVENSRIEKIVNKIIKNKAKIVGFSCYVWNIEAALEIAKLIKKKKKEITIVFGGPEPSYNQSIMLKQYKFIDYIVVDEGEEIFCELVESLIFGTKDISGIQGLCYREKDRIIIKSFRPPMPLDKIPSPFLMGMVDLKKEKIVVMETTRGCPFKCAFCSYNIRNYSKVRYFSVERIKKELEYVLPQVNFIDIIDDNFNINEGRSKQILDTIIKYRRREAKINLFIRADTWLLSEDLVKLLQRSRAILEIGVQSLNKNTLIIAKRLHNQDNLEQNLRLFDKYKIAYTLQFIIGLPGDTYRDIKTDIDWSLSFNPKKIMMQILRINAATHYQLNATALGLKYDKKLPNMIYRSSDMTKKELQRANLLSDVTSTFLPFKKNIYKKIKKENKTYSEYFERWIDKNKSNQDVKKYGTA